MSAAGWWLDELAYAGAEHLDARYVAGYDRKAGADPSADLEVLRRLGLDETSTLVDLGAGTGAVALAVAPLCRRVVAVDVSPTMLAALRARAEAFGIANVECVRAGFLTYVHEGAPADFLYSRNALHHLPDFWKGIALRRAAAMLRPGGVLRLHDLVYAFEPAEAERVIEAWVAGGAARPEGRVDAGGAGDARARGAQHVRLAAGVDAATRRLRGPRGERQAVADVRGVHRRQGLSSGAHRGGRDERSGRAPIRIIGTG